MEGVSRGFGVFDLRGSGAQSPVGLPKVCDPGWVVTPDGCVTPIYPLLLCKVWLCKVCDLSWKQLAGWKGRDCCMRGGKTRAEMGP